MQLCVFASEVAGLVGLTPRWATPQQVQAALWKRWDPVHFRSCGTPPPTQEQLAAPHAALVQSAAQQQLAPEAVQAAIPADVTTEVRQAIASAVNCAIGSAAATTSAPVARADSAIDS